MRSREILFEKDTRVLLDEFKNLVEKIANKLPDLQTVEFLLYNPMFRGMAPRSGREEFFISEYPKGGRIPKDNSLLFQELIDEYFEKKGFGVKRESSIFVTGNKAHAEDYVKHGSSGKERRIYAIIPSKDTRFVWNTEIEEASYPILDYINARLFKLVNSKVATRKGLEILSKASEQNFGVFMLALHNILEDNCPEEFVKYWEELSRIFEEGLKGKLSEGLFDFIKRCLKPTPDTEHSYRRLVKTILFSGIPEAKELLEVDENSKIIKGFKNTDLKKAVLSGHEIILSDSFYLAIDSDFLDAHFDEILNIFTETYY